MDINLQELLTEMDHISQAARTELAQARVMLQLQDKRIKELEAAADAASPAQ